MSLIESATWVQRSSQSYYSILLSLASFYQSGLVNPAWQDSGIFDLNLRSEAPFLA